MASINLQGDTSGAITISAPSVAGSNTLTLPATTQTLATQNALGVRNLIINGDMQIAQRGTSATSLTGAGYHTVDRFVNNIAAAGTWTSTQDADVPSGQGFAKSHKLTCTTATASPVVLAMMQIIEGQNLQHLKKGTANAESVTLSFWVKSNKTGTYIIELYDTDNTRNISQAYTINSADTWEKKTLTFAGDTTGAFNNDNNKSLEVYWWLAASATFSGGTLNTSWSSAVDANRAVGVVNLADSTSNYINITGVQLEVGDTATPFEHRPFDMELARCQRYFIALGGQGSNDPCAVGFGAGTTSYVSGWLPTQLRASPTMGYIGSISGLNVTAPGVSATATSVTNIGGGITGYSAAIAHSGSSIGSGVAVLFRTVNSGVYLTLSAEL